MPGGLVAIAVGTADCLGLEPLGLGYGDLTLDKLSPARWPISASRSRLPAIGHVFGGFKYLGMILVTAIPFGIYDLIEALDNVESAAAAGDSFPTTRVLTADGVISLIGCLSRQSVHQRGLYRPSRAGRRWAGASAIRR